MGRDLNQGKIHQIFGSVVDIKFEEKNIPSIYEALEVATSGDEKLVFEVQEQLPKQYCSMHRYGFHRWSTTWSTGKQNILHPLKYQLVNECLGRIFNVLGQPIDGKGEVLSERYPLFNSPSSPGIYRTIHKNRNV